MRDITYVGMDVHKEAIRVAVLGPSTEKARMRFPRVSRPSKKLG